MNNNFVVLLLEYKVQQGGFEESRAKCSMMGKWNHSIQRAQSQIKIITELPSTILEHILICFYMCLTEIIESLFCLVSSAFQKLNLHRRFDKCIANVHIKNYVKIALWLERYVKYNCNLKLIRSFLLLISGLVIVVIVTTTTGICSMPTQKGRQ